MILVTHATLGAFAAMLIPEHPVVGFCVGFASHFALDAIPHWEYRLHSFVEDRENPLNNTMQFNRQFLLDLLKIGIDFSAGMILPLLIFLPAHPELLWSVLAGAIGGVAPDFLQFVYFVLPIPPMRLLQRFHLWIHSKDKSLKQHLLFGASLQAMLIAAVAVVGIQWGV